jgi:hypothetical protein
LIKKKIVVEWIVSSMVCWRISSIFYGIFSSPGQRQCELLPSLDVRRKQELPVVAMIVNRSGQNEQS